MEYYEYFGKRYRWGRVWKNHKVILDEMVKYIYLVIKEQVIGAINEDDMKSHGYYILKLLSLNYK